MTDEVDAGRDQDRAKARRIVSRIEERREIHRQMHWLPRLVVVTIGCFVLVAGLAMLVLPGPAIVVIPIGLAILSLEFIWAERLLEKGLESGATFGGWLSRVVRHRNFLLVGAGLLAVGAVVGFLLLV